MPAKVKLKVVGGQSVGQEYVFEERTTCIVGRAKDCSLRLPSDQNHRRISRHHCLLDINPPDIRVRDLGSLNGTLINGKVIGKRGKNQTPEEGSQLALAEYDLKDGDTIGLDHTILEVSICVPVVCSRCCREVLEEQLADAEVAPDVFLCSDCREARAATPGEDLDLKPQCCVKCGQDVSGEIGERSRGEYLCDRCRAEPLAILGLLLKPGTAGEKKLAAIEGYEVVRELGRGGMGVVYLASSPRTQELIALKVILPKVAADEAAKAMFLRELENTKALRHPNVVELRDCGCSKGAFFFTLEYCDGGSVAKLLASRGGRLPITEAVAITLAALDGLHYAHHAVIPCVKLADGQIGQGRGLVHRDLKPSNIFLKGSGIDRQVKIADFGLSKTFDTAGLSGQTLTGATAGTPIFAPRQQVVNFRYAKPDVDVWAMAACLYTMLTGCVPRDFRENQDVWRTVLETDPVPIHQRDPSIPAKLAEVIDLALQDRNRLHFQSAIEFKQALQGVP